VVICLVRDAHDLHTVQLMPLPSTVSCCFIKIQNGFSPFLGLLTQDVVEKRPLNGQRSSSIGHQLSAWVHHCHALHTHLVNNTNTTNCSLKNIQHVQIADIMIEWFNPLLNPTTVVLNLFARCTILITYLNGILTAKKLTNPKDTS